MPANMNKTYRQPRQRQLPYTIKSDTMTHVETSHSKDDAQIPPMMSIRHVEVELHIRVRRPKGTECARSGRIRIGEVATCKSDVGVHVGAATHSRRWVDRHELGGRAGE